MSINATLIVQMIVFAILVWFTMKFIWPPITAALDERARKIADGLSADGSLIVPGRPSLGDGGRHRVNVEVMGALRPSDVNR